MQIMTIFRQNASIDGQALVFMEDTFILQKPSKQKHIRFTQKGDRNTMMNQLMFDNIYLILDMKENEIESLSQRKLKNMVTHWDYKQNLRYFFYLVLNHHQLHQKRVYKFFQFMGIFVGKMTNVQSRTHHQKQIGRHNNDGIAFIKAFYKNNYMDRMLGRNHLKKEIQHYLSQLKQEAQKSSIYDDTGDERLSLDEIQRYQSRIDQVLLELQFQDEDSIDLSHQSEEQEQQEEIPKKVGSSKTMMDEAIPFFEPDDDLFDCLELAPSDSINPESIYKIGKKEKGKKQK